MTISIVRAITLAAAVTAAGIAIPSPASAAVPAKPSAPTVTVSTCTVTVPTGSQIESTRCVLVTRAAPTWKVVDRDTFTYTVNIGRKANPGWTEVQNLTIMVVGDRIASTEDVCRTVQGATRCTRNVQFE